MRGNPAARIGTRSPASARARSGTREVGSLGAHHYRNAPDDVLVVDTLRACAGKSTSSVGPLITDTLRASGAGRAPDHGHIAVVPIQDAERRRLRKQHGIGIGKPGDPMFIGLTRGDHAVAFHATQDPISGGVSPALGTTPRSIGVLSFDEQQITHPENRARPRPSDPSPTLAAQSRVDILGEMRPRRLTPREWERLQGFPDDYTLIDGAEDSPRYEALGNSMAVPVMRWIGERLVAVEGILRGRR